MELSSFRTRFFRAGSILNSFPVTRRGLQIAGKRPRAYTHDTHILKNRWCREGGEQWIFLKNLVLDVEF